MSDELDLNNLGLLDDGDYEIDVDNLPEERSSIPKEILAPGVSVDIVFPVLTQANLEKIVKTIPANVQAERGQRLRFEFKDENALRAGLDVSVDNIERYVYDKGKPTGQKTNSMAQMFKGLKYKGVLESKKSYIDALRTFGGVRAKAENVPTVYCNPKKAVFKDGKKQDGQNGAGTQMGCGQEYRLEGYAKKKGGEVLQFPKDGATGEFKAKFVCKCGAFLTAWPKLGNFRIK